MCGVTKWDRLTNDEIPGRTGVELKLSYRAEQKGLRWSSHMERMSDRRMTERVMNAKAERVTIRGRPKMGWRKGISNSLRAQGDYPWRKDE